MTLSFKLFVFTVSAGLGEFKLRDINDEINKLLREKGHWEDRIKELDGPDYKVLYIIYYLQDRILAISLLPLFSQSFNFMMQNYY